MHPLHQEEKNCVREAGYHFVIVPSNIDESGFDLDCISSIEHTRRLSLEKARAVAKKFASRLVLGADTVVDFEGRIVGKPKDAADAERITRMLFSKPHKVITSVALVRIEDGLEIIETAITTVYPKKLTDQQIAEHIAGGDWRGKAGAYGIQETGDKFVERIEGSFTNIMGLPMELVEALLGKFIAQ